MRVNQRTATPRPTTHEGAPAQRQSDLVELRRAVFACLLFEDMYYETGESAAQRISQLAQRVSFDELIMTAKAARHEYNLRSVPLWLVGAALRHPSRNNPQLIDLIDSVCKRPDNMTELVAMYWKDGKKPLPAVYKRAFAAVFPKFTPYQLSKYAARGDVRLRDLMRLVHPVPKDEAQATTWKHLVADTLPPADTWETALSGGADKATTFTRLLQENKLGGIATLMNLRNMQQAGVDSTLVASSLLAQANRSGILPFQYVAAAQAVPAWEQLIEPAMLAAAQTLPYRLPGKTVLLVDKSGSMQATLSQRSTLQRIDAAAALTMLAREICDEVAVYAFNTSSRVVPARRGFALRDAIGYASGGTDTAAAVRRALQDHPDATRMLVFTDEQSRTTLPLLPSGMAGYVMNVASYCNGIARGAWHTVTGFSPAVLQYIGLVEGL